MNFPLKYRITLEICILLVIVALTLAIYNNGKDLSCNQCKVTFKQTITNGEYLNEPIVFQVNITDLYSHLKEDKCLVSWDRTQGYRINE